MQMRRFLFLSLFAFFSSQSTASWIKINDVDYVWGPFKIYNLSLFSESGQYKQGERPLMLSLKYAKPVEGRDFAISLARSWSNLGITLPNQEDVVDRLRKIMPNIRENDVLSYIALPEKGYFVLNNTVIPEDFNQDFNDAVVAVWLDPRVEMGRKLLENQSQDKSVHQAHKSQAVTSSEDPKANAPAQAVEEGGKNAEQSKPASLEPVKEESKDKVENSAEPKPAEVEYTNPEVEVLPPFDAWLIEPEASV